MVATRVSNLENSDFVGNQYVDSANLQSAPTTRAQAAEQLNVAVVTPEKVKHYRNKYDEGYQRKLALIRADIESGVIDRLTMKLGRDLYRMRDTRTRQAQIDLCRDGLLSLIHI